MVKEKKYSLCFQQKKIRVVGKARKTIRISSIKRLVWGKRKGNMVLDFLHKDVSLGQQARKIK